MVAETLTSRDPVEGNLSEEPHACEWMNAISQQDHYKARPPRALARWCGQWFPLCFSSVIVMQPRGPYQDESALLFGPSSH